MLKILPIVLIVVLLISGISLVVIKNQKPQSDNTWSSYSNKTSGYYFENPSNWYLTKDEQKIPSDTITSYNPQASNMGNKDFWQDRISISVSKVTDISLLRNLTANSDSRSLLMLYVENSGLKNSKGFVSVDSTSILGNEAVKATVNDFNSAKAPYMLESFFIKKGDNVYNLSVKKFGDISDRNGADLLKFTNSFRFIE